MGNETLFVDTSAFYALMDRSDNHHEDAAGLWGSLLEKDAHLKTTNYITIETLALLQSRLGFEAANLWYRDVLEIVEILWIDTFLHNLALELWFSLGRRRLSLVDCVSFITIRQENLESVFAFDSHFAQQGFQVMP